MESHSLFELNEYIRRVFALNFPQPVWVNCEISQIKEVKGNVYLDLIEQDDSDAVVAQASAMIWYKSFLFIKSKLKELTNSILTAGSHVRLKVQVDFNERYGYKLIIEDIDATYTIGRLELQRQKIIERLKKEEVWGLNKSSFLPAVLQNIAVISSVTAAGYIDFDKQLSANPYGYKIKTTLFQAAMQGQNTEKEVCNALDQIIDEANQFDAIFIIRGGGSKLDLSYFDNFNIAYKICMSPIPVFAGIGHEIDESIADMVAFESLKTPTACAAMIIERALHFESEILSQLQYCTAQANNLIKYAQKELDYLENMIKRRPLELINTKTLELNYLLDSIKQQGIRVIKNQYLALSNANSNIKISDPSFVLNKGYAIISQENSIITSKLMYKEDKSLQITFKDGKVERN